jgi:hypothetical protein
MKLRSHRRKRSLLFATILVNAAAISAVGAEYTLPAQPRAVTETLDPEGKQVVLVDWGAAGGVIPRTAADVEGDWNRIKAYLQSQEFHAAVEPWIQAIHEQTQERDAELVANLKRQYETTGQLTTLSAQSRKSSRTGPVPAWLTKIQPHVRQALCLAIYNDSDPAQRRWLIATALAHPNLRPMAIGWDSQQALAEFQRTNPQLDRITCIATVTHPDASVSADDFVRQYGVETIPVLIEFPDAATIRLTTGLED